MDEPAQPKRSNRGRPRKSARERAVMRDDIAATARRLFKSEGYANISIRRLARELGCAPMTLYQHFDAKIDILRTLWDDVFADLAKELDAVTSTDRPEDRLQSIGVAYVSYWLRHEDHYRLVFMTEGVDQKDVGAFIGNANVARCFDAVAEAVRALCPTDAPAEIALRSDFFICLLQGVAHNHITISGYPWSRAELLIGQAVEMWRPKD